MGLKAGMSLAERRVAENTLPLALSKDPKDIARFGELVSNYPQVIDFYNRLTVTMNQAIQNVAEGLDRQDKSDKKPQRAVGGRIHRATGGGVRSHEAEADRLVSMVEQARRQNSVLTEPLINSDDNLIAKALEVANRQYEG
jgi:hypothetical protein